MFRIDVQQLLGKRISDESEAQVVTRTEFFTMARMVMSDYIKKEDLKSTHWLKY